MANNSGGVVNDGFEKIYPLRIIQSGNVVLYRLAWNKKKHYVTNPDQNIKFLVPFIMESKVVYITERIIDFVPVDLDDKNKMDIRMDMVATVKVTDATKYYTKEVAESTVAIDNMLINKFNECLKDIVSKYPYKFLIHQKIALPVGEVYPKKKTYNETIVNDDGSRENVVKTKVVGMYTGPYQRDPNTGAWCGVPHFKYDPLTDNNGDLTDKRYVEILKDGFICDMAELKANLDDFEKKYGLKVVGIECKSFKPASERIQKMQDELQAAENETKIEAERLKQAKLKAEANLELLNKYISMIKDNYPDVSKDEALELAKHYMYTSGGHADAAKEASAAVTGAVMGATANQLGKKRF